MIRENLPMLNGSYAPQWSKQKYLNENTLDKTYFLNLEKSMDVSLHTFSSKMEKEIPADYVFSPFQF